MSCTRILLGLLIGLLPDSFPLLIVVDDTIERRSGKKIKAKGCYRDACRSTQKNIVKCYGLKWVCLMLVVPLPWCKRPWALPFMTLLAPSKKSNEAAGKKHRTSIDWTILAVRVISRWLKRPWVLIGDGGFACIRLGHACIDSGNTLVSRLRLDAALYETAAPPRKGQRGRHREKGNRMPSLKMSTAWYDKKGDAAFSDVLVCVRREIWRLRYFNDSGLKHDHGIIAPPDMKSLLDQLARAA